MEITKMVGYNEDQVKPEKDFSGLEKYLRGVLFSIRT